MPTALPDDIVNELKDDFSRGFEDFRGGAGMAIGGLVLSKNTREGKFVIQCFSSCYFSQNITRAEAEERIGTAKKELAHLFSLFPELERETLGLSPAFYFCWDTGKAAVVCATEEDGRFTYHDEQT